MILELLQHYSKFAIYGAQVVAYGAYVAIKYLCSATPDCFVVSDLANNPREIDGISVRTLAGVSADTLILIAVTELLQDEIAATLREKGYEHTFRLDAHEEHLLMSRYFAGIGRFPLASAGSGAQAVDLAMYEVRNHRDKPLTGGPGLQSYEHAIQAGADTTADRIACLLDNSGDHMSAKNRQYAELSATYWIWKNTRHEWKGVEHYRRHLLVEPGMLTGGVDVVLPLPYLCYPNTLAQFRRFVSENVLDALVQALRLFYPRQFAEYLDILNGPFHYTYNLVCARKEIFDDYCAWLFGVTQYLETLAIPEIANTRALSYVAEVLTNLYFMSREDVLKIRHVEKRIYI